MHKLASVIKCKTQWHSLINSKLISSQRYIAQHRYFQAKDIYHNIDIFGLHKKYIFSSIQYIHANILLYLHVSIFYQ